MEKLLIISFDAVSSDEWEKLREYPNVKKFAEKAAQTLDARSVFLSNTYPAHCSVATGVLPCGHGVISNTEPFPMRYPQWITSESAIKVRTLWHAADEAGLSVASILWPCTGGSSHIRWNMPEIPPMPGKNQVLANLFAGSKMMQARLLLKYRRLLDGIAQPELDSFVTACAEDILRHKQPDLTLVHLTCYDMLCHRHGRDPEKLSVAFDALDKNLGRLMDAAGSDCAVLIFSDHAHLSVHTVITPNDILVNMKLLQRTADGYAPGADVCFIECCGGSAFFHAGGLSVLEIARVKDALAVSEGFGRFLIADELRDCGRAELPFGFAASPGYMYESYQAEYRGNHGYPLDMPDYHVFYAVKGDGFVPGERRGGGLLDIAPIAAKILGINMESGGNMSSP